MDIPILTREVRRDIARDIAHPYLGMCSKVVITFDTHGWQVLILPRTGERFVVPGGPHTVVIQDGRIQE